MLNTANGAGAGKSEPRFGREVGGEKASGPKATPNRMREVVDRIRAKGNKLEPGDMGDFLSAMFADALTPRPGREHTHLTAERADTIDKMTTGMTKAMGEVVLDHGIDKAMPILIGTAITQLIVELDQNVQPGLIASVVRSLKPLDQGTHHDAGLEEMITILFGDPRIPGR